MSWFVDSFILLWNFICNWLFKFFDLIVVVANHASTIFFFALIHKRLILLTWIVSFLMGMVTTRRLHLFVIMYSRLNSHFPAHHSCKINCDAICQGLKHVCTIKVSVLVFFKEELQFCQEEGCYHSSPMKKTFITKNIILWAMTWLQIFFYSHIKLHNTYTNICGT